MIVLDCIYLLLRRKFNGNHDEKKLKKLGEKLAVMLPRAGPAFVKLGQFLSTRQDIINPIICNELKQLHDQAPKIPFKKIQKILLNELRKEYFFKKIIIEEQPIAAASIAQVHKGKIQLDGDEVEVAVKILRPNIKRAFRRNIKLMKSVANIISNFIGPAKRLRLTEVMEVIESAAKIELDMKLEAAVADKMKYNLSKQQNIFIPKIFWDYTTKQVLVMEWVHGWKIDNPTDLLRNNIDIKEVAKNLAFTFFQQAYNDGFFHADIHPGNILITGDSKIALIDFGLISYLPEKDRLFIAEIIYAFTKKDYEKVAQLHFEAGYVPKSKANYQDLINLFALSCRSIAEPIAGKPASEISMSKLLRRLFEITSEFKMHTQPQLLLLQKNMVTLEGTLLLLDKETNMWELVEPWFEDWARQHLGLGATIKRRLNAATQALDKFISHAAEKDNETK